MLLKSLRQVDLLMCLAKAGAGELASVIQLKFLPHLELKVRARSLLLSILTGLRK